MEEFIRAALKKEQSERKEIFIKDFIDWFSSNKRLILCIMWKEVVWKKDEKFNETFSELMEQLKKCNHACDVFIPTIYKTRYLMEISCDKCNYRAIFRIKR
jgi:hypothetical protein